MKQAVENIEKEVETLRIAIKSKLDEHGLKQSWLTRELQTRVNPKISVHVVQQALGGRVSGGGYEILVNSKQVLEYYEEVYLNGKRKRFVQR